MSLYQPRVAAFASSPSDKDDLLRGSDFRRRSELPGLGSLGQGRFALAGLLGAAASSTWN
eukprot:13503139-Alexandrium_andersonii.AAC.1